jgi:hypothetical protein
MNANAVDRRARFHAGVVFVFALALSAFAGSGVQAQTFSISGAIRDASSGTILTGHGVELRKSGNSVVFVTTDSDGKYQFTGLEAGSDYAVLALAPHYLPTLQGNVPFTGDFFAATPIAVGGGNGNASGVGIDVAAGLSIRGTLVDESGDAAQGQCVTVHYRSSGRWAGAIAFPEADGSYITDGLPDGADYGVAAAGCSNEYVGEFYDDIPFDGNWAAADPVTVGGGTDTENIDFVVAQAYSISGTVTDAGSGDPVTDAEVCARLPDNSFPGCSPTDANGAYTISGLAAGSEYKITARSPTYAAALYDGLLWPTRWESGTAVAVGPGDATGIDFQMVPGNTIAGRITDAQTHAPLSDVLVCILDRDTGLFAGECTLSDGNGDYVTGAIQPGDDYLAFVDNVPGYASETYDNQPWPTDRRNAKPIDISGGDATDIDFALGPPPESATVTGTVSDIDSSAPVANATVAISDPNAFGVLLYATTDAAGVYSIDVPIPADTTRGVLPAAERQIIIEAAGPSHAPQRFGAASTPNCFFNCAGGDGAITVTAGDAVTANIQLPAGGNLEGTVTAADTGDPIENAAILIARGDSGFFSPDFAGSSDASGAYRTSLALPPGDYVIGAETRNRNFVTEAWNDVSCEWRRCPRGNADPVTIEAGSTTAGIDFALATGATLSGTLSPSGAIQVYDAAGRYLIYAFDPWTVQGLAGGSYYIEIRPVLTDAPYQRELHNGEPCPWLECAPDRGAPINVPPGGTLENLDYTLSPGGFIGGTVVDAATGDTPVVDAPAGVQNLGSVDIIDLAGQVRGGADLIFDGTTVAIKQSFAVPPGEYYVRTYDSFYGVGVGYSIFPKYLGWMPGFADQLHAGVPCAGLDCNLGLATPITVTSGSTTGITIELQPGSNAFGSVVDDATGDPLVATTVKLVDVDNNLLAATITDDAGAFDFGGFPAGTYYLRTSVAGQAGTGTFRAPSEYFDRVHGDSSNCSEALCDPAAGTAITLDGSSDAGPFELRVRPGPVIRGQIIDQSTGLAIYGGHVDVFDDLGEYVGTYVVSPADGHYQTTALSPGTYTIVPEVSPAFVLATSSSSPSAPDVRGQTAGFTVNLGSTSVQADTLIVQNYIFGNQFE